MQPVSKANWRGPADIRAMYNTADFGVTTA